MRSVFAAMVVSGLSVALLARSVSAEAPPPMESRSASSILAALRQKPALETDLVTLRFYVEVAGGDSLQVPVGSEAETAQGALDGAEQLLCTAHCRTVDPSALKAASALMREYGPVLPLTLRAWTLGHQGKKTQAADLLAKFIEQESPEGKKCPSEHPTSSYHRAARLLGALGCLQAFAPNRDVTKLKKLIRRAEACAENNAAAG